MLWVHHEAEELRVHHRSTVAPEAAWAVVVGVLASGRIPPLQASLLGLQQPNARPLLQRLWATVYQHGETGYLLLFINDRCLVFALSR